MDEVPARTADPVEALIEFLTPAVIGILRRIDAEEFTTPQFIEVMRTDPAAAAAYDEAVHRWGEQAKQAKMVVHGQVIPLILRRSDLVEWAGYAHGEDDDYAVPAWWTLRRTTVAEPLD